jgi:GrpB-like predicted nucleotidyltransferase (UPF0157 family)
MIAKDGELLGGPERYPIVITDYDPAWPARFADHADTIATALGARALRIEHIGSTSVPGLPAKPIIDVLVVVERPEAEDTYVPALARAGYVLRIREPSFDEHRMLRTPQRDMHLHVFPPHSPEVQRYLVFRDLLRSDPAARQLYTDTKRALARRDWPTTNHYADAKTDVIETLIARGLGTA